MYRPTFALLFATAAAIATQSVVKADDCSWAREMGFGDMCDGGSSVTQVAPPQSASAIPNTTASITVCNQTSMRSSRMIHVVLAYGPESNQVTTGLRLLDGDECETFNVPGRQGDAVWVRAYSIHDEDRVYTRSQGKACYSLDYYREIPSSTREACDRTAGNNAWESFELLRVPRDLSIDVDVRS